MLESLESRKLFAATLADASPLTTTPPPDTEYSLNFTKITFGKVASQDFHFSMKVAAQDFHFVKQADKPS
jgi:hypothetical protein